MRTDKLFGCVSLALALTTVAGCGGEIPPEPEDSANHSSSSTTSSSEPSGTDPDAPDGPIASSSFSASTSSSSSTSSVSSTTSASENWTSSAATTSAISSTSSAPITGSSSTSSSEQSVSSGASTSSIASGSSTSAVSSSSVSFTTNLAPTESEFDLQTVWADCSARRIEGHSSSVFSDQPAGGASSAAAVPFERLVYPTQQTQLDAEGDLALGLQSFSVRFGRDMALRSLEDGRSLALIDSTLGVPQEFLNAESFPAFNTTQLGPFTLSAGLVSGTADAAAPEMSTGEQIHALGLKVQGPTLSMQERAPLVLTVALDLSDSMLRSISGAYHGGLGMAKNAIYTLLNQLKPGDRVNLVTFNDVARIAVDDWAYDESDCRLVDAVAALEQTGPTDLGAGLQLAYELADARFDAEKVNRILLISDGGLNVGQLAVAQLGEFSNSPTEQKLTLSAFEMDPRLSITSRFGTWLPALSELGDGAYLISNNYRNAFEITEQYFMSVYGKSLRDVRLTLSFPESLSPRVIPLEPEASDAVTVAEAVDLGWNREFFFLEQFSGQLDSDEPFVLQASYTDEDGMAQQVSASFQIGDLMDRGADVVHTGLLVTQFAELVQGVRSCESMVASPQLGLAGDSATAELYRAAIEAACPLAGNSDSMPLPAP